MAIKVNVHSNSSAINVNPKSNKPVGVSGSSSTQDIILENKLKVETAERIAADERLQAEIDTKQDTVEFIFIPNLSGVLEESKLNLLIDNQVNRLVFGNRVYYLSLRSGSIRKYFSTNQSSSFNEIDIDLSTGEYQVISTMDVIIAEHLANSSAHVSDQDRTFWNNKVTAAIDSENVENLILTKN